MAAAQRGASIIEWMVIDLNEAQVKTLEQVRQVLEGARELVFQGAGDADEQRYEWIEPVLRRFGYRQLGRADRGAVLVYVQHLSGWCRAGYPVRRVHTFRPRHHAHLRHRVRGRLPQGPQPGARRQTAGLH